MTVRSPMTWLRKRSSGHGAHTDPPRSTRTVAAWLLTIRERGDRCRAPGAANLPTTKSSTGCCRRRWPAARATSRRGTRPPTSRPAKFLDRLPPRSARAGASRDPRRLRRLHGGGKISQRDGIPLGNGEGAHQVRFAAVAGCGGGENRRRGRCGRMRNTDAAGLALGQFDGEKRAAAAEHVLTCGECRREFDEVNSIVGELLPVVPAVQPKLGFRRRGAQRLGIGAAPQRRHRRWVLGVAAAAVVGWTGDRWWLLARSGAEPADAAPLQLADGVRRDRRRARRRRSARMVVAIVDAPADVSYTCRITLADRSVVESPAWDPGAGAWLVPLPGGAGRRRQPHRQRNRERLVDGDVLDPFRASGGSAQQRLDRADVVGLGR